MGEPGRKLLEFTFLDQRKFVFPDGPMDVNNIIH